MKRIFACILWITVATVHAETDQLRTWTATGGAKVEAKLIDNGTIYAVLEKADGSRLKIRPHNLSQQDQNYLKELKLKPMLTQAQPATDYKLALDQVTPEIKCEADPQWSYYMYLPPNFHTGRKWPVMFIQSPGGGSAGTMNIYIAGARKNGWILAVSRQSRNGFDKCDEAVLAMIEDVRAKHPIDEKRMYSSGFSGGARESFFVASEFKKTPLAGVLACGAGRSGYNLDRDTVVYGLCGSNCFNRWDMACTFEYLKNDDSRLWFFPGGHSWGNSELISDGICWLNGCYLKDSPITAKKLIREKYRYTKMMLDQIETLVGSDPERAYRLGRFMEEFGVPGEFKGSLKPLMAKLRALPTIQKYDAAEKEMYKLVSEHFATDIMDFRNNNCPKELTEDANSLADKYPEIKLSETIHRMGKPTKIP